MLTLENVKIAAPCTASWDKMKGDDRVRHCGECKLNVYNISNMTRKEAEALIAKSARGEKVCARMLRRADGTIVTSDCPVGVKLVRAARLRMAAVSAAIVGLFVTFSSRLVSANSENTEPVVENVAQVQNTEPEPVIMGKVAAPDEPIDHMVMGGIQAPVDYNEMGEIAPQSYEALDSDTALEE